MEECTLSERNFALFLWRLARYWSYNWASLAAKTCSRLKQGWWVKINPEISMSSWKFPGGSPDPIICWLLCTYLTACQREQSTWDTVTALTRQWTTEQWEDSQTQNTSYKVKPGEWCSVSYFLEVLGACSFLNTWKVKWKTRERKPLSSCFQRPLDFFLSLFSPNLCPADYSVSWVLWLVTLTSF